MGQGVSWGSLGTDPRPGCVPATTRLQLLKGIPPPILVSVADELQEAPAEGLVETPEPGEAPTRQANGDRGRQPGPKSPLASPRCALGPRWRHLEQGARC